MQTMNYVKWNVARFLMWPEKVKEYEHFLIIIGYNSQVKSSHLYYILCIALLTIQIYFLILRGNAHISKNYLRILLLGVT